MYTIVEFVRMCNHLNRPKTSVNNFQRLLNISTAQFNSTIDVVILILQFMNGLLLLYI